MAVVYVAQLVPLALNACLNTLEMSLSKKLSLVSYARIT
jgi:hypothetical protein